MPRSKVITQFQFIKNYKLKRCIILLPFFILLFLTSCQNSKKQFQKAMDLIEKTEIIIDEPLPHLEGLKILRKLVAKDYAPAMDCLAFMHERGLYVTKSPDTAYLLYRKAADLGDEYARQIIRYSQDTKGSRGDNPSDCCLKALKFRFGINCSFNSDSMLLYYEKCAESGDISSLSMLGDVLYYGIAETEDRISEASKWYYAYKMLQDTVDFDIIDIMEGQFGYLQPLERCKDSALVWLKKYYPDKFPDEQNDSTSEEVKALEKIFGAKR